MATKGGIAGKTSKTARLGSAVTGHTFGVTIDSELYGRIDRHAQHTGQTVGEVVESALRQHFGPLASTRKARSRRS